MRKETVLGMIALAIFLVSIAGIPEGYARDKGYVPGVQYWPTRVLGAPSNPTGDCTNLGLTGGYGVVGITRSGISVSLRGATPNKEYQILVGYEHSTGTCDGTWQPVGAFNTDSLGNGNLSPVVSLPSGRQYVFELKDENGNVAFATSPLEL